MKRKRNLILLIVVLAVLGGVYFYLSKKPVKDNNPAKDDNPAKETKSSIEISSVDKDKISKITLQNSKEKELTFEKEVRTVKETKEKTADTDKSGKGKDTKATKDQKEKDKKPKTETVWKNTTYIPVKLDQSKVEDLARVFSSLVADDLVEKNPKNLSIYGLDKPAATGTALLDDGKKIVLYLGDKTAEGNTHYLMKEGDPRVFTVYSSNGEKLGDSLADYRDKSLPQIDLTSMSYLYLSGEGQKEIEIKKSDQSKEEAQYGLGAFQLVKPYKQPRNIDSSKLDPKLEGVSSLAIKDFVDDQPADPAKYGLDHPKRHFILKDETNTLDLLFGNSPDEETIYFKTADSDSVYTMEKSLTDFMNIKPMEIADKFALIVNIEDVDKVVLEGKGETHTLSMTRRTEKAKEKDKEDEVVTTYFLDGKKKEEDPFKDFYQSLIGIVVDAEKDHTAQGQPDFKITYYLNKGSRPERNVAFIPYDDNYYSVVQDGDMESEFLITRKRLDWVMNDLANLMAGKTKDKD